LLPLIHMTKRGRSGALLAAGLAVLVSACTGEISKEGGPGAPATDEMVGAGGRDVAEYWQTIEHPLSQNTRMLSYSMLKSEVMRATGRSWVVGGADQWERNRGPLGGADFVTTFADDLTPSQQRIVLIRKMAFQVCGDLVNAEAGAAARPVFSELDPGVAIDAAADTTKAQIAALFKRFFLEDAAPADLADGAALLGALGTDPKIAWRGLCASYVGSMRFLTY
jgi:hypothetical protein